MSIATATRSFSSLNTESSPQLFERRLRTVDPLKENGWEKSIVSHPNSSFFHSTSWAQVLKATYGHKPFYLASENPRGGCDLLPVMEVNSPFTGKRGVSLPFTDAVQPLMADHSPVATLFDQAITLGKQRRWKYIELRGGSDLCTSARASLRFWGHNLDLTVGLVSVFKRFDPSVRRATRKAEKEDMQVEISTSAHALHHFYHLHCQTRRQHGVPPQPVRFFRNILEFVLAKGLGVIVTAWWRETPVASAMFFHFGSRAIYKFGASNPRLQHLRGNNLVMWHAIQWYASHGYDTLDFGRTSLNNEGLRRYKQHWGTREFHIDYFKYDLRRSAFVGDHDNSNGWHTMLFSRAPIALLRLTGAVLYRHLS